MSGVFINDFKVKVFKDPNVTGKPPKNWQQFPTTNISVAFIASRRSGKTIAVGNVLDEMTAKNGDTIVIIFSNTVNKGVWIPICNMLEKKGIEVVKFTDIVEDKVNHLDEFMRTMKKEDEGDDKIEDEKPPLEKFVEQVYGNDNQNEDKPKKKRPSRYETPAYVLVFDDVSGELHIPAVNVLIKNARNYRCSVIISTQHGLDIRPELRRNLEYAILFGKLPESMLETYHHDMDLNLPLDKFIYLYKLATAKQYDFLHIDKERELYRRNFDFLFDTAEMFGIKKKA